MVPDISASCSLFNVGNGFRCLHSFPFLFYSSIFLEILHAIYFVHAQDCKQH